MGIADLLRSVSSSVGTIASNSVVGWANRQTRQRRLKRASRLDLLLALLAARLSRVAYANTQRDLLTQLHSPALSDVPGGLALLHFRKQRATCGEPGLHPQWFLARGAPPSWLPPAEAPSSKGVRGLHEATAVYLVFRGTWSATDIIRDICVEPEPHADGAMFHGGFLRGVRDDTVLHAELRRALSNTRCEHLYIFGHSLGGSLAFALAAGGLIPPTYKGSVTVVGVGAPPVRLSAPQQRTSSTESESTRAGADDPGDGEIRPTTGPTGHAGRSEEEADAHDSQLPLSQWDVRALKRELRRHRVDARVYVERVELEEAVAQCRAAQAAHAASGSEALRYLLVVNDCDVVPRLLGSPMPVATAALLTKAGGAVMRRHVELMETMQSYCHPPSTEGILLRDGEAKSVPSRELSAVLHLHEALSPALLDQHGTGEYVGALEIAAAIAEAHEDEES